MTGPFDFPAPSSNADHRDAVLLRLRREMKARGPDDDVLPEGAAGPDPLLTQMEDTPAHTLAGLIAKAQAIDWCTDGDIDVVINAGLALSIVRDLLALQHEEPGMSGPFDFLALAGVADRRDAELLATLDRLSEIRDQLDVARRRGSTAYQRAVRLTCQEFLALDTKAAATTAFTSMGRRAKAMHALRMAEADPDQPSGGFTGLHAVAFSALHDILQAGAL